MVYTYYSMRVPLMAVISKRIAFAFPGFIKGMGLGKATFSGGITINIFNSRGNDSYWYLLVCIGG
jgi:hypothetical protein